MAIRQRSVTLPLQSSANVAASKIDAVASTSTKNNGVLQPSPAQEKSPSSIEVKGFEFGFDPSIISLEAGEKVELNFINTGDGFHNWVLEGTSIRTQGISSGQTDVIEFTAPAKGTYKYYCSISGHREAGMKGTLTVN